MFEESRKPHAVVRYVRLFSDNDDIVFSICVLFDNFLTIDRRLLDADANI
jgi:hypothetical protein